MKLIRFRHKGTTKRGALVGDTVYSLEGRGRRLVRGRRICRLDQVTLLAPVVPTKIVAVAMNYSDNLRDSGLPTPQEPIFFLKPPSSVVGPSDSVVFPSRSSRLDYEAELAVVVAQRARAVPQERAHDFILGYTCGNDVTARDLQKKDWPLALCKSFDTFCPLGPVVETDLDPCSLAISLRLNGKTLQSSSTANMIFDPFFLLSYLSSVMTLEAGDVILTGSPSGVGPMEVGQAVEVDIEGIGVLRNQVIADIMTASAPSFIEAAGSIAGQPAAPIR